MRMEYISTRGIEWISSNYAEILLAGLAPDGGLYVPERYPTFSEEELRAMQGKPYVDIAFKVKRKLIGEDIDPDTLKSLIERAYSQEAFPKVTDGNVTPLQKIADNFYVQNLSLGPTAAFKDMALRQLAQEMNYELEKRDETLVILGATSGDTGSAAEAAFKGLKRVKVFILSPEKGMSDFQKAQMGSLTGDNIFNISVRGRFDDCQDLVKLLKGEEEFSKLGAVNSINWGRISSQVPYYFSGYLQAVKNIGEEVDFIVPTGNFGNIMSGYIAKKMGLPVRRLIVATNENDVLDRLFKTGVYALTPAQVTSSPSMDISKASNYERLVFNLFGNDPQKTRAYMQEFAKKGRVDLRDYGVSVDTLRKIGFESGKSTHEDRMKTIKRVYDEAGFVIDTHTADAVHVGFEKRDIAVPTIAMGTALPVKFEHSIKEALGFIPKRPARFVGLELSSLPDSAFYVIDNNPEQLRAYLRAHAIFS